MTSHPTSRDQPSLGRDRCRLLWRRLEHDQMIGINLRANVNSSLIVWLAVCRMCTIYQGELSQQPLHIQADCLETCSVTTDDAFTNEVTGEPAVVGRNIDETAQHQFCQLREWYHDPATHPQLTRRCFSVSLFFVQNCSRLDQSELWCTALLQPFCSGNKTALYVVLLFKWESC